MLSTTGDKWATLDFQNFGPAVAERGSALTLSQTFSTRLGAKGGECHPGVARWPSGHQRGGLRLRGLEKEHQGCCTDCTLTPPCQPRIPRPVPTPKEGRPFPCHPRTPPSPRSLGAPPTHGARASGHSGGLRVRRGAGCFEAPGWHCAASSALPAAEPPPRRPLPSPPPCP